jgi:hypothetical protein
MVAICDERGTSYFVAYANAVPRDNFISDEANHRGKSDSRRIVDVVRLDHRTDGGPKPSTLHFRA